jgi:hypothetical protein
MKKIKYTVKHLLVICVVCFLASCSASKTVPEKKIATLEELKEKEYKTKIKEFRRKDLEVSGTTRSIEVALLTHLQKLDSEKYTDLQIISENCPTINLCSRKSLTDASAEYATLASSFLRGKVNSEAGFDASNANENLAKDRFYAAYEQKVSSNISGVLKRSFSVHRKEASGYYYESYYLVETEVARKARMQALHQALQETKQNVQWGNTISDYINDTPTKN